MTDIFQGWLPQPILRRRPKVKTLENVLVYSDFRWNPASPGFGPTSFPGHKLLARDILRQWQTIVAPVRVLLTSREGFTIETHRLVDGGTCFIAGIDFLRQARTVRTAGILRNLVPEENVLAAAAVAAAQNADAILEFFSNPNWHDQIAALRTGSLIEHATKILQLTSRLFESAQEDITGDDHSSLTVLASNVLRKFAAPGAQDGLRNVLKLVSDEVVSAWLLADQERVGNIVRNRFSSQDVVALAYRRKELLTFDRMLSDDDFFKSEQLRLKVPRSAKPLGPEAVWQKFFERNRWIFGTSLQLTFLSKFGAAAGLEEVTTGATFAEGGKRVDALMKTVASIQALCFVEIKTHKTELLAKNQYRGECWNASTELTGGIAQVQKTVHKAMLQHRELSSLLDKEGHPTDTAYLVSPKSYLVVGRLSEFQDSNRNVSVPKYSSFQLLRRSLSTPEIVTFDELFERAKALLDGAVFEGDDLKDATEDEQEDATEDDQEDASDDEQEDATAQAADDI